MLLDKKNKPFFSLNALFMFGSTAVIKSIHFYRSVGLCNMILSFDRFSLNFMYVFFSIVSIQKIKFLDFFKFCATFQK